MRNLSDLYNNINFCAILTTGRTGSDYLQACLDNVPGVLTFSGHFHYYKFCENLKINEFDNLDSLKILELFIKKNHHLFTNDSEENKFIDLNLEKFKNLFKEICKNEKLNRKKFLLAIYYAYHLTLERDDKNIITMVHHAHHVDETRKFLKDFKSSKLLITIRDPRANLKSGILNWSRYDKSKENQHHFYLYIKRIREDLKFAKKLKNEKLFVKLEEANEIATKKKLTNFLSVKYSPEIMKATFAGKVWIGDKLSQFKSLDGEYNKKNIDNEWNKFFTKKDKLILDFIYKDYIPFGYNINKTNLSKLIYIFFLIPFPFFFDKNIFNLKYYFERKVHLKKKIIDLYFYLKRVLYLYTLLFRFN